MHRGFDRVVGYQNRDARNTNIGEELSQTEVTPDSDPCANLVFQDDGRSIPRSAPTPGQLASTILFPTADPQGDTPYPYLVPLNVRNPDFILSDGDYLNERAIYSYQLSGVSGSVNYPSASPVDGFYLHGTGSLYVDGNLIALFGSGAELVPPITFEARYDSTIRIVLSTSTGTRGVSEIRSYHAGLIYPVTSNSAHQSEIAPAAASSGVYVDASSGLNHPWVPWVSHVGEMVRVTDYYNAPDLFKDCCKDVWAE